MATPITPLVVYVARESSATGQPRTQIFQWLLEGLRYIEGQHKVTYDIDGWQPPKFFTYIYSGNDIWFPRSNHALFMLDVIAEAQRQGCPVVLVVSGWAGLTTSPEIFDQLLSWFDDSGVIIYIRVFAEVPREFFDINVQQARGILRSNLIPGQNGLVVDESTSLFVYKIRESHTLRIQLSEIMQMLVHAEIRRNAYPGWVCQFMGFCEVCGEKFPSKQ